MRGILFAVAGAAVLLTATASTSFAANAKSWVKEETAQKNCKGDTVVYINEKSGIYHMPGSKNYGKVADGKYACLAAVQKDGRFTEAKNGQ